MSRLVLLSLLLLLLVMIVMGFSPLERYHRPMLNVPKPPIPNPEFPSVRLPDIKWTYPYMYEAIPLMPLEQGSVVEVHRPYRLVPYGAAAKGFDRLKWLYEDGWQLACYCTMAYKRLVPLAGCAVLTVRHVLTTAWPVDEVLKKHPKAKRLQNLLGWWYNTYQHDIDWNGTRYMSPARIHFHPQWFPMEKTNMSHPFPVHYDLAVLTGIHPMSWKVFICSRAGPRNLYTSPMDIHRPQTNFWIVGNQFIRAWKRNPMVNFRYGVRVEDIMPHCPKVEWGWFMCVQSRWSPLGMDSGAPLHRSVRESYKQYDGLIAMNSISMTLRNRHMALYFTILNTHPVLDFLYRAYMGTEKVRFLDERYPDSRYGSLKPYTFYYIPWEQEKPDPERWMDMHEECLFWDG